MPAIIKPRLLIVSAAVLSFAAATSSGQNYGDGTPKLPDQEFRWPEGAKMALSLTFDDARFSQIDTGIPLLDKYGVKATFYISPGNMLERADGWKSAVGNGHEIGNHSLYHPCSGNFTWSRNKALEDYTLEKMTSELDSANRLIQKVLGVLPVSFGYPCGQTFTGRGINTRSYVPLVASMFSSGRGWMNEAPNDPVFCDLSQLNASELDGKSFEQVLKLIETARAGGHWLVLAGHEMNVEGYQTSRLATIEAICKYASDPANGIWIDNVRDVAAYVNRERLSNSISRYRKGEITVKARAGAKISVEQLSHEFWFGCAISNGLADGRMKEEDLKQYKEKFLENFNSAVTENAVKWYSMEQIKDKVNYATVDGILKWTGENDIPLRGHNLFWGIPKFVQPWIRELSDEELLKRIKERAITVTSRYKGRFAGYDLNNEMIHGNYYEDRLGPEITKQMAQWALEGDPDAQLFVNDYEILTGNRLADYMAHIRSLLKQGIPIEGIGVQGHSHSDTFDRRLVQTALDSLAIFDLPILITEFNMPGQRSKYYTDKVMTMTPEEEEQKARELVDFYSICFAHPAVEGILMWGFWEGNNWIPVSSLYRRDWTPTPAAGAYHNLVFKEWWTSESGTAGADGSLTVPAFFGKYRITVDGVSTEVELSKQKGIISVELR